MALGEGRLQPAMEGPSSGRLSHSDKISVIGGLVFPNLMSPVAYRSHRMANSIARGRRPASRVISAGHWIGRVHAKGGRILPSNIKRPRPDRFDGFDDGCLTSQPVVNQMSGHDFASIVVPLPPRQGHDKGPCDVGKKQRTSSFESRPVAQLPAIVFYIRKEERICCLGLTCDCVFFGPC